ncbi:diacylglycerol kinase 5-like protein, partial [Tanacetum coccineum]
LTAANQICFIVLLIYIQQKEWTPPYVDDGFLEIVGFRNAWHDVVLYAPSGHGTRLAQARGIRFEFHKGAADHTFMRMDKEPWKQPLPRQEDTVTIEISRFGHVSMLASGHYPSKSVNDPLTPRTPIDGDYDSDEEEAEEISEERKKFGATSSFQLPEDFHISQEEHEKISRNPENKEPGLWTYMERI